MFDEFLQLFLCRAAFDEGAGFFHVVLDGVGLAADIDGCAGIEEHDVGLCSPGAREDGMRYGGVFFCHAAAEGRSFGVLDAEVLGGDRVRLVPAVLSIL